MRGRVERIVNLSLIAAILGASLFGFQNCSKLRISGESQGPAAKNNGGIYGGKPYRHFQLEKCSDGSSLEGEILFSASALLVRENCAPVVPPRELTPSEYQMTAQGLVYGNRLFVSNDPEFIQNKATVVGGSITASLTVVYFDQPTQAGHLLLCLVEFKNTSRSVASVVGASGAAFSRINQARSAGSEWTTELWYLENAPSENSVRVNFNGPFDESTLDCFEYGGVATANSLESQVAVEGSGNPMANLPGVSDGSLVFYYFVIDSSETATAAPGFTTRSAVQDNIAGDLVATSSGSYAAIPGPNPLSWNMTMASFRRAGP